MVVGLLTEHHLEFLSLKRGCRGSSESTLVKMSNCWKSHAAAQMTFNSQTVRVEENPSHDPPYCNQRGNHSYDQVYDQACRLSHNIHTIIHSFIMNALLQKSFQTNIVFNDQL